MPRRFLSGADYVDALPSGEYVARVPHVTMLTHLGNVAFPAGQTNGPLFVRCTNAGGFKFAGQAPDTTDPACFEWSAGTGWKAYPPPCCGNNTVIYDRQGGLHRADCAHVGSQGYRYVAPDGSLVTGDATYGPAHDLNEWTALSNGWRIGQSNAADLPEGVTLWDGSAWRTVEPGNCRFIRATDDGAHVCLAFVRPDGAVVLQTTFADLAALPPVVRGAKPPQSPTPQPPASPSPEPTPTMTFANHLDIVQQERARFPQDTLTEEQCFTVTNRVVKRIAGDGWGLTKAPAGGSGFVVNGQNYRLDKLSHRADGGYINDILKDTPGKAGAQWGPNLDPAGASMWAPAVEYGDATTPAEPPSVQPPATPDDADLKLRVGALEAALEHILTTLEAVKPPVVPDLSAFARKGDKVTVKVPFLGPAHGSIDQ